MTSMPFKTFRAVLAAFALIAGLCSNSLFADEIGVATLDLGKLKQDNATPEVDLSVDKHPLTACSGGL